MIKENEIKSPSLDSLEIRVGDLFSAEGHLDVYNSTHRPYPNYQLENQPALDLLNSESHLWLPCQGQTK